MLLVLWCWLWCWVLVLLVLRLVLVLLVVLLCKGNKRRHALTASMQETKECVLVFRRCRYYTSGPFPPSWRERPMVDVICMLEYSYPWYRRKSPTTRDNAGVI